MELTDYLRVLRRRWILISVTALVVLGLAAGVTFSMTPQYTSSARLFVSTSSTDNAAEAYQGGQFSVQRVTSYADLVDSRELAQSVIEALDLDLEVAELSDKVSASVQPTTVNLRIEATDADPQVAQHIAQAYAEGLGEMVRELETPVGETVAPIKATIVDTASLPGSPSSPQVPRNLALGLILGLFLGGAIAFVRELLDNSIKSGDDVAAITDAPLMGTIAFDNSAQKRPLITSMEPHAPRVESFRVLRTNLQFVDVDRQDKVFVVTSAVPGEGKTTTSVNLALTLAQAGTKTLLVEGDLRRPKAADALGLDPAVGVTTVLVGKIGLDDALQSYAESGLDVLASGAVPPNPAELLQSNAMADLLGEVRNRYDIVIIDGPPLLPVTDAALLSRQADGALLVVRHGRTTKDQLEQAIERLEQVEAHPIGLLLNMVPLRRRQGQYGYGYGYAPTRHGES